MARKILLMVMLLSYICSTRVYGMEMEAPSHEYTAIFASATDEDMKALEQVVYWESVRAFKPFEDGSYECSVAVVETVLNRVSSGKFKSTIYDVCHQKHQFVCKPYKTTDEYKEMISDAIDNVVLCGRTVLPSTDYTTFATKKQTIAKNHVWIGQTVDGKPKKGKGMYFGVMK